MLGVKGHCIAMTDIFARVSMKRRRKGGEKRRREKEEGKMEEGKMEEGRKEGERMMKKREKKYFTGN